MRRDRDEMALNACAAIPVAPRKAQSVNAIFIMQKIPRLPRKELEALCEYIASTKDGEVIIEGEMRYFRWKEFRKRKVSNENPPPH